MALSPTDKKNLRLEIQRYCLVAEKYEARWHYSQQRPYTGLGKAPSDYHSDDCSAYCALVFWWAGHIIQHGVADPLGEHYNGWGNTDTAHAFLDAHPAPRNALRTGDIAIFGTLGNLASQHMQICRKNGDEQTAVFSSHGQEAGPQERTGLMSAGKPLIGVYRHPALL